jgi:4-hydroxy-tetrahydrodipicolinate reductase
VVGTTGLDPAALEALAAAAAQVPVVRSANMSLGVNVLLGLVERAVRALPGYDIEIAELHHRMKQDAPSGTALALAQAACRERELSPQAALRSGRSGQVGARTADEVGVLALRGGDVVGEHTVYLLAAGERLELTHRATSREIFVHGALRAARWVRGRPPGLYDMQDVLGLR